jgi:23S rRNA (cytidine1920-2'-O)/16S rRNA (cytidine1409-2'-O)-methyltransferase
LREHGRCVPLIKPQFEAGKGLVGKGGVVKDPNVHRAVLFETIRRAEELKFSIRGLIASPILGPAGNREFLALLEKSDEPSANIDQLVEGVVPR